jgi:ribosomal protein L4
VLMKSCRNIPSVELQRSSDASTYQIMRANILLIQKSALEPLYEVFGIGKKEAHPEATAAD